MKAIQGLKAETAGKSIVSDIQHCPRDCAFDMVNLLGNFDTGFVIDLPLPGLGCQESVHFEQIQHVPFLLRAVMAPGMDSFGETP